MADHKSLNAVIDKALADGGLTPDEILTLTIAHRLNTCSDNTFALAMGEASANPKALPRLLRKNRGA